MATTKHGRAPRLWGIGPIIAGGAVAIGLGGAEAGGIDRSGQDIGLLFETGNRVALGFSQVSPDVSGTSVAALGGGGSGDMAPSYNQVAAGVKFQLGEAVSVALIYDQPFGADAAYEDGTGYFAQGARAEVESHALTAIGRYALPNGFSAHAGLRYQRLEASAAIPFVANYAAETDADGAFGYLLGVAYERPEIALRVALTYNSRIDHELSTRESSAVFGPGRESVTEIETPDSINLDMQTGIAPDTLLFGQIRWVNWSDFAIEGADYEVLTGGALVDYAGDYTSYTIGLGRRFNETWAGRVALGYEPQNDAFVTNLGPTDGNVSFGLGASYTNGPVEIAAGARYVWVGDARTRAGDIRPAAIFENNDTIGIGVEIGYAF